MEGAAGAGEAATGGEVGRDKRRRRPRLAARKGATEDGRWRPRRAAGHGRAATGGGTGPRGDGRRGRAVPRRAAEQSRAATAGGDDGWRRPLLSGSRDARQKQRRRRARRETGEATDGGRVGEKKWIGIGLD